MVADLAVAMFNADLRAFDATAARATTITDRAMRAIYERRARIAVNFVKGALAAEAIGEVAKAAYSCGGVSSTANQD